MQLRSIALIAALAASVSAASAALVTTTYYTGAANVSYFGPEGFSIGLEDGDSLRYSFAFDDTFLPPDLVTDGEVGNVAFAVTAGDVTVSTIGTLRFEFLGVMYPFTYGWIYNFMPTGPTTITGQASIDGGLVDASTGAGWVDFSVSRGNFDFYPGAFLHGLLDATSMGVFGPQDCLKEDLPGGQGYLRVGLGFELLDNGVGAVAGLRSVPEPSAYGLLGVGFLLGIIVFRRRLLRR